MEGSLFCDFFSFVTGLAGNQGSIPPKEFSELLMPPQLQVKCLGSGK